MGRRGRQVRIVTALILTMLTLNIGGVPYSKAYVDSLRTSNVFLVVIDGVRYSETFGDAMHGLIPHIWNDLRPLGTIYTNFSNDGVTLTVPGHTSMLTGVWQKIKNDGTERPHQPTIFEYYRKETGEPANKTWVVVKFMNLNSTDYSDYPEYGKPFGANIDSPSLHNPAEMTHSGDFAVWDILEQIMNRDHPSIVMVNFGMADSMGHSGNWSAYTNAIRDADMLTYRLWQKIENDSEYKEKTTVFVTNDHGRHLDDVKTGFREHGDDCEGCRHVMMLAVGAEANVNTVIDTNRHLIDIAPTIGHLLGFATPLANGTLLSEMLVENRQPETGQTYPTETIIIVSSAILMSSLTGTIVFLKKRKDNRRAMQNLRKDFEKSILFIT